MDFTEEQHTEWFPGTEKPGEDGLYKRRKKASPQTDNQPGPVMYCLWEDGWWYEGSEVLTSALNIPLRKSHYQPGHWEDFEWCGLMPGAYERPDVVEAKAHNFVGGFFTQDNPHPESIVTAAGQQQILDLAMNADELATPKPALDIADEAQRNEAFVDLADALLEMKVIVGGSLQEILEDAERISEAQQFGADFFGGQS